MTGSDIFARWFFPQTWGYNWNTTHFSWHLIPLFHVTSRHLSRPASSARTSLSWGARTCKSPHQPWTWRRGSWSPQAQCRWKRCLCRTWQGSPTWGSLNVFPCRSSGESQYLLLPQDVRGSPGSPHHLEEPTETQKLTVESAASICQNFTVVKYLWKMDARKCSAQS